MFLLKNFSFNSSFYFLSFITGIHNGFLKTAVNLWLYDIGVNIINLGLFNIVALPGALRMFWMPFIDLLNIKFLSFQVKKTLLIIFEFCILILFVIFFMFISFANCDGNSLYFLVTLGSLLFLIYSFVVTKETLAISYQFELLDAHKNIRVQGKISGFYNFGVWGSGALLIFLKKFFSWNILFLYFVIFLFFGFLMHFFIKDIISKKNILKNQQTNPEETKPTVKESFLELFNQNKNQTIYLIGFIVFYRLQDKLIMAMSVYFFLSQGFTNQDLSLGKTVGVFLMTIGGIIASHLMKTIDYRKGILLGMFAHALSCLFFIVNIFYMHNFYLFYATILLEKFSRGFEGTIFFSYQRFFCSSRFLISQIGWLNTFDKISSSFIGLFSGIIVFYLGWLNFFLLTFIGIVPALYCLSKLSFKK